MTYAVAFDVPAPVSLYDAIHAEVVRQSGGAAIEGLLVHLGRATAQGFQVLEVWTSREHFDRYNKEVVEPVMAGLGGGRQPGMNDPSPEEFDLHGLVLGGGEVVI